MYNEPGLIEVFKSRRKCYWMVENNNTRDRDVETTRDHAKDTTIETTGKRPV